MAEFYEVLKGIKGTNEYAESSRMLHYIGRVLENKSAKFSLDAINEVKNFALDEAKRLMEVIPAAQTYKQRDNIFAYEDALMHIFTVVVQRGAKITEDDAVAIKALVSLVASYTEYETTVENILKSDKISKEEVEKIVSLARSFKDEYQRGKIFTLLLENKDGFEKFTTEAKSILAEYTEGELKRILNLPTITEDIESYLEIAVDVSKHFATENLLNTLSAVLELPYAAVRYYATETLLKSGKPVPQETITALANNLSYAGLTYGLLNRYGKSSAFPKDLSDAVYLAKSDLVHWLIYPTELNKEPDEIEFIGSAKVKKETYYVFKFKSDSDNLENDLHNVWLIGWSGSNGGTFSNFDLLSDYEGKTDKKTLKNVVKKLIK